MCEIECCHAAACSVTWYSGKAPIDTADPNYRMSSDDDGLVHVLTLLTPEVVLGQYGCVLDSSFHTAGVVRTVSLTLPGILIMTLCGFCKNHILFFSPTDGSKLHQQNPKATPSTT